MDRALRSLVGSSHPFVVCRDVLRCPPRGVARIALLSLISVAFIAASPAFARPGGRNPHRNDRPIEFAAAPAPDARTAEIGIQFKDSLVPEVVAMLETERDAEAVETLQAALKDRAPGNANRADELNLALSMVHARCGKPAEARQRLFNLTRAETKPELAARALLIQAVLDRAPRSGSSGGSDLRSRSAWHSILMDVRGELRTKLQREHDDLKEAIRMDHWSEIKRHMTATRSLMLQGESVRLAQVTSADLFREHFIAISAEVDQVGDRIRTHWQKACDLANELRHVPKHFKGGDRSGYIDSRVEQYNHQIDEIRRAYEAGKDLVNEYREQQNRNPQWIKFAPQLAVWLPPGGMPTYWLAR